MAVAIAVAPAPARTAPATAPSMPSAIAAVLGAMAPIDVPHPMMSGPGPAIASPAAAPVSAPALASVQPVSQPIATPPPLTPRGVPVTSAPPVPAAKIAPTAPSPARDASIPLFAGSSLPPQPAGPDGLGVLRAWTPQGAAAPSASGQPNVAASAPPQAAPSDAPKVAPQPLDATQSEFDAFIANGPYGREGQALLKMLGAKAPDFCRAILRRTVVRGAPLIVIDGARAGADRRAGFAPSDPAHPGAVIALSAGPLLVERKKGMFGKTLIALPEDPRAWAELGLATPALDALSKTAAPASQENGPWGMVRIYADHSRHGTYSTQEQAGELLERLLLLGLEREGFASSTYAARAWARAARLLFSARLAEDYGGDSFLDPDRRLELRDWIERGDESDDLMIASWSSSRGNVLDPRRGGPESQALYERQAKESCTRSLLADHLAEAARSLASRARTIEALAESGLIGMDAAKISAERAAKDEAAARAALLASPPVCDGRFGADEAGLRRSNALLAEVSRAERAFRERKAKVASHD